MHDKRLKDALVKIECFLTTEEQKEALNELVSVCEKLERENLGLRTTVANLKEFKEKCYDRYHGMR